MAATTSDVGQALNDLAIEIQHFHRSYLRSLRIELLAGGVVLRGQAASYYGKQLAFHEVRRRCKFTVVANDIEVQDGSVSDESQ